MAIIGITLGLAGPRIGAGLGTIELRQAEQTVKSGVQLAKRRAQRVDADCFVVFDNVRRAVDVLGPDMKIVRDDRLPSSVQFVLQPPAQSIAIQVAPSGIVSGDSIEIRGRNSETQVSLR